MAKDSLEQEQEQPDSIEQGESVLVEEPEGVLADEQEGQVEALPAAPFGTGSEVEPILEVVETVPDASKPSERREIVRSATLVMLGNLGSSVMGMVRQSFVALNGSALSGPFLGALSPAQKFNDFLINGSVGGALIPTFNDYASPDKREEFRRLVFTLVNLVFLIMAVGAVVFFFIAPWVIYTVLEPGWKPDEKLLTLQFARIIFFSLLALGPFAVLQAALFARKEFGWTAFATSAYHIGIIVGATATALLGGQYFGRYGIALGVLLGALGEIALLIPAMRKQRLRYMFVLDLRQPAFKRILRLYIPVAFSFIVSNGIAFLDQSLASQTPCIVALQNAAQSCGNDNYSAMMFATVLIQFPIGLVAAALSFAVLPTLTAQAREENAEGFKETLLLGFRLGLLLMIPAAAGLIVLRTPIVALIFQRHNFSANNTLLTATALQNYAYQLPFVALDQLLINAFYARKNTITPVVVLLFSVLGYLAVALPFWQTWGMPALPLANTVQNSLHAVILLVLLRLAIGPLHALKMLPTLVKILIATAAMIVVAWGLLFLLNGIPFLSLHAFIGNLIKVLLIGGVASGVYFGSIMLLKVEEIALLKGALLAKLGRK